MAVIKRAIIVGGGIGGLCAAIAPHWIGVEAGNRGGSGNWKARWRARRVISS